eukprot:6376955-Heterocapsa_arctica.AAC.1
MESDIATVSNLAVANDLTSVLSTLRLSDYLPALEGPAGRGGGGVENVQYLSLNVLVNHSTS